MDYAISRRIILYPDGLFYVQTVCAYIYGLYPDGLFYFPADYPIFRQVMLYPDGLFYVQTDCAYIYGFYYVPTDYPIFRQIKLYHDRLCYIPADYPISQQRIIQYRNRSYYIPTDYFMIRQITLYQYGYTMSRRITLPRNILCPDGMCYASMVIQRLYGTINLFITTVL